MQFLDYDPSDIDVRVSELLVATSDAVEPLVHPNVSEALAIFRQHLNMDVVFVSQFQDGRRTFRVVESKPGNTLLQVGQSDPVEESWCQHVVSGRLPQFMADAAPFIERGDAPTPPFPIGTHLSTPILLGDGSVYGTLCCFSQVVEKKVGESDLHRLRTVARLLAEKLGVSKANELQLQPLDIRHR